MNFGVGGYGVADEELQLEEMVLGFSPRYVVVVVFTGNDFRDTFLGVDKETIVDGVAHLDDARVRERVPEGQTARGPGSRARPGDAGSRARPRFVFCRRSSVSRTCASSSR